MTIVTSDPDWLSTADQRSWRALQRMQAALSGALARQLGRDSDLSYPDYQVLVALTDQPEGRLRLNALGRDLGWEQSRASHQVARMVARGLVSKQQCGADRRGCFVVVTKEGHLAIERAAPGHVAAVRKFFLDGLDDDQLAALGAAAQAVLDHINEGAEHDPPCG